MNHETHETHEKNRNDEKVMNIEADGICDTPTSYCKVLFKEESYAIQGAIFEVYKEMGSGFLESVYQECLSREFSKRGIHFLSQVELTIFYKGIPLAQTYRSDFVCYDQIIIELKALKEINNEHRAQMFNYLKATGYRLGILVNFGHHPRVAIERIVI